MNDKNSNILNEISYLSHNLDVEMCNQKAAQIRELNSRKEQLKNGAKKKDKRNTIICFVISVILFIISILSNPEGITVMIPILLGQLLVFAVLFWIANKLGFSTASVVIGFLAVISIGSVLIEIGILTSIIFIAAVVCMFSGIWQIYDSKKNPKYELFEIQDDEALKCYRIFEKYGLTSIFPVSTSITSHGTLACKTKAVLEELDGGLDADPECDFTGDFSMFSEIIPKMDKEYTYPDTITPVDVEQFWNENSKCHAIISKYDDSPVTEYFGDATSDTLRMPNDIREQYIKIVDECLDSLPKIPDKVDRFLKTYHETVEGNFSLTSTKRGMGWVNGKAVYDTIFNTITLDTPNFHSTITSDDFVVLAQEYDDYMDNLKRFDIDKKGTYIGAEGERQVYNELQFFSNNMKILQNIRLELNGESIESDLIVICNQGIYIIEVKNLGSTGKYNISVERDGRWIKEYENGKSETMPSITQQNMRHIHGIETIVNHAFGNSSDNWLEAHSIIVFANDKVDIKNESSSVIVRKTEIINEIRRHERVLNEDQINRICDILQEKNLPPLDYEIENWYDKIVVSHFCLLVKIKELEQHLNSCMAFYDTVESIPRIFYDRYFGDSDSDSSDDTSDNDQTPNNTAAYDHGAASGNVSGSQYVSNSDEDEFDRAVGNCEMENSYSYSWYDEDYNKPTWEK